MRLFFVLTLLLINLFLSAQNEFYPKAMAPWEKDLVKDHLEAFSGIKNPPVSRVRSMAEWEEAQALLITWTSYPSVLAPIVKAAQKEGNVIIVCSDSIAVKQSLKANQIDTSLNIKYLIAPFNSVWVRDYGPNTVYKDDIDSMYLVDWIYNRPRYKDDTVSNAVAKLLNVPLFNTAKAPYDLVNTGGNFMSDGSGQAFASMLVLDENDEDNKYGESNHSEEDVDSIMYLFMGIENYIKMTLLPNDGIHHIDMHMKLLDETTLLVGQYPKGLPDEPQIEANIQYVLDSFKTVFGTDFNIIRIPMPPYSNGTYPGNGFNRTYTNAVFFNKTVIIPAYEEKYDTTAIRIWKEALPGYTIAPVNCNGPIQSGGAVHCISKEIGVADPLRIVHNPLKGEFDESAAGYYTEAKIQHVSGIKQAGIWLRTDTSSSFELIEMIKKDNNIWSASFPGFTKGQEIQYYIEAIANNGRTRNLPMPAPKSFCRFKIKGTSATDEILETAAINEIYPNPASAITCITLNNHNNNQIDLFISDGFGRKIKTIYSGRSLKQNYFINAADFKPGIYFVVLQTKKGIQTKKLVVR
ncbi:MAG: agmatine deiminase family protein [Saprospiraceae bacterium]|nr:agmatine deiminase family protein [Saprospiraceae bacterium]